MEDPTRNNSEASMETDTDAEPSSRDSKSEQNSAASDGDSSRKTPDGTDSEPDRKSPAGGASGGEDEEDPGSPQNDTQRKKKSKKALKKKEEKARKKQEAKQAKKDRKKERYTLSRMASPKEIKSVSENDVQLELANGYFNYIMPKTVEGYRYRPGPDNLPIIVEESTIKPLQYSVVTLCDKIMLKQREKE